MLRVIYPIPPLSARSDFPYNYWISYENLIFAYHMLISTFFKHDIFKHISAKCV